jgi:hypothetical protein
VRDCLQLVVAPRPRTRRRVRVAGPYLTWTRKVDSKTVTRTLGQAQAERLRPLLDSPVGTVGDMASAPAPRNKYPLVYLVFNIIYDLLTQDAQVRCFDNAARPCSAFCRWLSED